MSFASPAGGPIASAFVEVTADTSAADRSIDQLISSLSRIDDAAERAGEGIESAFREAARTSEDALDRLGGAGTFTSVENQAERAGEGIEDSFAEAQVAADRQLEQIGGPGTFTRLTAQSERTGEAIERDFREASRSADRSLRGINFAAFTTGAVAVAGAVALIVGQFSDLEQAVGATESVFDDASTTIARFASDSVESVGLSEASFRQLTAVLGGLLQSLGFTGREAAQISTELAQVGADLAATFGGTTQQAVETLGAALRGEFDSVERFGISLRQAEVNARAVELGLAASTQEVDSNARAVATLDLIMSQAANTEGQFARESNTIAGQLQRLTAESQNAAAGIGESLQPQVAGLLATAREDLLPALVDLAEAALPALLDSVVALVPTFVSLVDIATALTPVLEIVAAVLGAIPPDVIVLVSSLATLRVTMSLLQTQVTSLALRFPQFASGLGLAGGAVGIAAIALLDYATAAAEADAAQREFEQGVENVVGSAAEAASAATGLAEGFRELLDEGGEIPSLFQGIQDVDVAQTFEDLGITAGGAAAIILQGEDAVRRFLQTSGETGPAVEAFAQLSQGVNEAAEAELEAAVAAGELTSRQFDQIAATGNFVAGLETLIGVRQRDAAATEAEAAAEQQALEATQALTEANALLGPSLDAVRLGVGDTAANFAIFAVNADAARLSEEQFAAVAAQLGVPVDTLRANIESVARAVADFTSAVQSSLPSAVQNINSLGDDVTLQGIRDELARTLTDLVNFNTNIGLLVSAGFTNLAAIAAEGGPAIAAALAQPIKDGRTASLNEFELLALGITQEEAAILANTQQWGLAHAGDLINAGQLGTAGFDSTFHPEIPARDRTAAAQRNIRNAKEGARIAGAEVGTAAAQGFAAGIAPTPTTAQQRTNEARLRIRNAKEGISAAGSEVGASGAAGFGRGIAPMPSTARSTTQSAVDSVSGISGFSQGSGVGASIADGMAAGVAAAARRVSAAAAAVVSQAIRAAKEAARASSPSLEFRDLGLDMGAGLSLGLGQSEPLVTQSAAGLAESTFSPFQQQGTTNNDNRSNVVNVNVAVNGATAENAQVIGRQIGDQVARTLERNRLIFTARTTG